MWRLCPICRDNGASNFRRLRRPRAATAVAKQNFQRTMAFRRRWLRWSLGLINLDTEKATSQLLRVLTVWQRVVGAYRILGRYTPLISQVEQCRALRSDRRALRVDCKPAQDGGQDPAQAIPRTFEMSSAPAQPSLDPKIEFCDRPVGLLWECAYCATRWGFCYRHGERSEQCFICGWSASSVSDVGDVDDCDGGDVPARCQQIINLPGPSIVCGGVDHLCEIPEECRAPLFCRRRPLDFVVYHYE